MPLTLEIAHRLERPNDKAKNDQFSAKVLSEIFKKMKTETIVT